MGKGGVLNRAARTLPLYSMLPEERPTFYYSKGGVDSSNCFTGSSFGNGYEKPGNSPNSRAACSLESEVSLLLINRLMGE